MTQWHKEARDTWPKAPIGYVLLLDLTDRAGKAMYGNEWRPPQVWGGGYGPPALADAEAFVRFEDTCRLIAEACDAGALTASYRFSDGNMRPMPQGAWQRDSWLEEYFEWGCIFLKPDGAHYRIFVKQDGVDGFIANLAKHKPVPRQVPPETYERYQRETKGSTGYFASQVTEEAWAKKNAYSVGSVRSARVQFRDGLSLAERAEFEKRGRRK